jgi:periplasmic protein CpxP/Spy
MYKFGFIILTVLLAFSYGCGNKGQNQSQGTEQAPPFGGREGRGMGGRGQFSPADMAQRQTDRLAEAIQLNDDQKAQILEINKKYAEKSMEMRRGGRGMDMSDAERQEMRTKMAEIQAEKDKEIKAVLSAEQQTQYDEYQKEMQQRMQERMQQGPPQN